MGSTVRADSNFRHFVNSLRKRGYQYAAGYVAAVGTTVANATTAAEVWRNTKDVTALYEMLAFFRMVCRDSPLLQEAFRVAQYRSLTAAEKASRIHELVPDPFALIADGKTKPVPGKPGWVEGSAEELLGLEPGELEAGPGRGPIAS